MQPIPEFRNPQFAREDNGQIAVEINHPEYGWIPFTADPLDSFTKWNNQEFWQILIASGQVKPYVAPVIPLEVLESQIRLQRDLLLQESDWTQLPDVPQNIKDVWAVYRQALRDVPQQAEFPLNVVWPTKP